MKNMISISCGTFFSNFIKYNFHTKDLFNTKDFFSRNPYRAIYGHMHLDAGGHTGHAKPEHFKGEAWNQFVKFKIGRWEDLYSTWLVQVYTVYT